jgi:hypothetical protein
MGGGVTYYYKLSKDPDGSGDYIMKNISKVLGIAGIATLSIIGVTAPIYASTYNASTNTITADGNFFVGTSGADFVSDNNTDLTITGTADEIRDTLIGVRNYVNANAVPAEVSAFLGRLAAITDITLNFTDPTATLVDADINYIDGLAGFAGMAGATVNVTSIGDIDITGITATVSNVAFGTVDATGKVIADSVDQLDDLGATPVNGLKLSAGGKDYTYDGSAFVEDAAPAPIVTTPADVDARN